MPKASNATASERVEVEGYEGQFEHWDGGYSVGFEKYTADVDLAPLFVGLPDDRCQCPHWGYVVKGKLTFPFADREEVFEAGDAFYVPPGHTQSAEAGTECILFSPTEELKATDAAMMKNMQEMQGA
jgi:hypothetical protein